MRARLPLVFLSFAVASAGHAADVSAVASPSIEPAHLVYLLEYVGTDYGGAVQDGKIVSASEYGEALRFIKDVIRESGAALASSDPVLFELRQLEALIEKRAPAEEVRLKSRRILPELSRALGGSVPPAGPPDLARGERLWRTDCAPCHGLTADGKGWAAAGMEPKPTPLRDQLELQTPRQIRGAVSYGIEGTAMPSYLDAYDEGALWDVAFYTMTLRADFEPRKPQGDLALGLETLVVSTNAELLAALRLTRPEATTHEVDYLRVSFPKPSKAAGSRAGPDAGPATGLSAALQLQDAFGEVAQRVLPLVVGVAGYVNDPAWFPEQLRAEKGQGWMAANANSLHYPGFRPVRTGSGVLADAEGYVLSSNHLVRDERGEVVRFAEVELQDGAYMAANVVGTEPTLDLAVLRVFEPKRVSEAAQKLEFAANAPLRVGQWLIEAGDPPGPEKIFAVGIVAAPPSRQCYQAELSATLVQSSLVVPQGGLGGPVFDIHGRVVGLRVEPQAATGILPIGLALNLFEALKLAKSNLSPWIGVSVLELGLVRSRLKAEARSSVPPSGVQIDDVFDPSPAFQAGVRPGDFLIAIDDHKLFGVPDFQRWLYVLGVGARVELAILREGKPVRVPVTIEARPASAVSR